MKYKRYVEDVVLTRTNFHCAYCGTDLLADLESFLTLCRDHLQPRSRGGPDGHHNRMASCAACDRLKGSAVVEDLETARELIAGMRANHAVWFKRIRAMVRGGEETALV